MSLVMESIAIKSDNLQTVIRLKINNTPNDTGVDNVEEYLDIPFPIGSCNARFPPLHVRIIAFRIQQSLIYYNLQFSLQHLFECLDVYNVISVVEAILYGEQIVLLASNPALLTIICESFLALIWPLSYPFPYVPLFSNEVPLELVSGTPIITQLE